MNGLDRWLRQLRPEGWIALMAAVAVLTVLAVYLYLLKPSVSRYRELAGIWSPVALESAQDNAASNERRMEELEAEIEALRGRLYGRTSTLPLEQMESHVIAQLDAISRRQRVQLVSVTPGAIGQVLMFDELPYDVDVRGDYFALFDWLRAVEDELRPMVVKRFQLAEDARTQRISMTLRLVSYRPAEGDA